MLFKKNEGGEMMFSENDSKKTCVCENCKGECGDECLELFCELCKKEPKEKDSKYCVSCNGKITNHNKPIIKK